MARYLDRELRMRSAVYHLLRRTMAQEQRDRLKRRVAHMRQRAARLYVLRHGHFGAGDIRDELARRLPRDFEILMVHCSLNDLHPMYTEGATELLAALLELCGPDRTLAMPAFFFAARHGGVGSYYRAHPRFDVRRQPSEMGLLSEVFRRRAGVLRSMHPTHSVCALGPLAEEITASHHLAGTIFGEGTPFAAMAARSTVIVGIGTEYFRCLTQVHAAEDLLGERYPIALRQGWLPISITSPAGDVIPYSLPVATVTRRRHTEMLGGMLGPDELVRWRFRGVPFFITSAGTVTEALMNAALDGRTIYDERFGGVLRRKWARG